MSLRYNPTMEWIHAHKSLLGILADSLTFLGGLILARDALLRLRDLRKKRTDEDFRKRFSFLNLTDDEWEDAVVSLRWALGGFVVLLLGFFFQLLLRIVESD